MSLALQLLKLMRPQQWIKNLFVFAALFFSGHFAVGEAFAGVMAVFLAFCLASSAVYCFNDLVDMESDRRHPVKSLRPIASGRVTQSQAAILALALLAVTFLLLVLVDCHRGVLSIIGLYVILNVAYTLFLKRVAIVDAVIIAIGFVLRLLAGGVQCDIVLSQWIVILTFLLSLLLVFGKRLGDKRLVRDDETKLAEAGKSERYSEPFLMCAVGALASAIMLSYFLYAISETTVAVLGGYFYITGIFVVCGILRYCKLIIGSNGSTDPTYLLFRDRFIQITLLLWIVCFTVFLYV